MFFSTSTFYFPITVEYALFGFVFGYSTPLSSTDLSGARRAAVQRPHFLSASSSIERPSRAHMHAELLL